MVAGAQARDAKGATRTFENQADKQAERRFRGSFSGYERNVLFLKTDEGFVEGAQARGLDDEADGRAVAALDYDGDGDQDLAVLSLQHLKLMRNETPAASWIELTFKGKREALALGAEVTVTAGGRAQLDRVRLTAGFHTQVALPLHFGLGDASAADVEVRWPSGETQRWAGLAAKQRHRLVEGQAAAQTQPRPAWPPSDIPPATSHDLTVQATDLDGKPTQLAYPGRPTVVNFWAPWCEACERELPELARLSGSAGTHVGVVGVSVETKKLDEVRGFIERFGLTYPQRLANDAVIRSFFGPAGKMRLPATFVFDDQGRLVRALYREVKGPEIATLVDSARTRVAAADWLDLADSAYAAGDKTAGARWARLAARFEPHHAAQVALTNGDPQTALRLAARHLSEAPQDPQSLALRGAAHAALGNPGAAKADLDAAYALAPQHPQVLHNRGMLLLSTGDKPSAIAAFEAALKADPEFSLPRDQLRSLGVKVAPAAE